MANSNLRDGLGRGQLIAEDLSGNLLSVGRSIQSSELTSIVQSGTYTSAGAASVYVTFDAAFASAPVVLPTPSQAAGFSSPFVPTANLAAGSFAVSGGAAHTGTYVAYGISTGIST